MIEKPQGRPPFRADHVGSLLRPQVLRQAFRDHAGKRIDDAHFCAGLCAQAGQGLPAGRQSI